MLISVIIPTYRPMDYLWRCLDSICEQSFPKNSYEVILILNGCKEPFESIIKDYIYRKQTINWLYLQTERSGVSTARNIGLEHAKGDYIAFIDDDDFVSPSYLEELYLKAAKDVVSLCRPYAFIDGKENSEQPYEMTDLFNRYIGSENLEFTIARKFFSGPCMKLVHRSIINGRLFDSRFSNGEDSLFMFLISDRIKSVSFTSADAIYYRRFRDGSAVTRKRSVLKRINNSFRLILEESHIFFSGFPRYRFSFYMTRIMGAIRSIILG